MMEFKNRGRIKWAMTLFSIISFVIVIAAHPPSSFSAATSPGALVSDSGIFTTTSVANHYNSIIGSNAAETDLFTGTSHYSLPIIVPSGRNGMEPSLALIYRSNNPNGFAGMGWEIELGSIERNLRNGLDYLSDEYVFRSSGAVSELVNVSPSEYRAQIERKFNRIEKLTAVDGQPYWLVTDKSGTQYRYGSSADSRQDNPADKGQIFKWCLDKVIDTNDNFIQLYYFKDQGAIYPQRIEYNGHSIIFYREAARIDSYQDFKLKFPVTISYRLKTIDINANGADRQRAYGLTYKDSAATDRSLLKDIILYDRNANVNTTTGNIVNSNSIKKIPLFRELKYSDIDNNYFNSTTSPGGLTGAGWLDTDYWVYGYGTLHATASHISGDFNGDGRTDILKTEPFIESYFGVSYGGNNLLALSSGNATFTTTTPVSDEAGFKLSVDWVNKGIIRAGDFNADGKTDLFLWRPDGGNRILQSNGDGSFTSQINPLGSISWNENSTAIFAGHFDSDGKSDILRWNSNGTISSFLSEDTYTVVNIGLTIGWSSTSNFFPADYNGDGLTDILKVDNSGNNQLLLCKRDGSFEIISSPAGIGNTGSWMPDKAKTLVGDYNGDGKQDLLKININSYNTQAYNSTSTLYLSKGDGGFLSIDTTSSTNFWESGYQELWSGGSTPFSKGATNIAGDMNGDDKTDIFQINFDDSGTSYIYLSKGNGTFRKEEVNTSNTRSCAWLPGDYTGNGKEGVFGWKQNGSGNTLYLWANEQPLDLLEQYTNSIGGSTTIAYNSSTIYANTQLPFAVKTVSSITFNDGNDNIAKAIFTYAGGYYHISQREFRGFNYVKTIGPAGKGGERRITETYFHQGNDVEVGLNNPAGVPGYLKGAPYRVRVKDQNGTLLSLKTTRYKEDTSAPFFNPPYRTITQTFGNQETKLTSTITLFDDTYGNLLRQIQSGDETTSTTTIYAYSPNAEKWITGLPSSISIYAGSYPTTNESLLVENKVKSSSFYYDATTSCTTSSTIQIPEKGNLTRKVDWFDAGTDIETRMAYDSYGNLACSQDANKNEPSSITYDSSYTFPITATNSLGQVTLTDYYGVDGIAADNGLFGQVKRVIDPNESPTTTEYDTLGRKTLEIAPDNYQTNWAYNDTGVVGTQDVYTSDSAGQWLRSYFDGQGRVIKEEKSGPEDKTITVKTEYDSLGLVHRQSLPFFKALENPRFSTIDHDALGRATMVTRPDGTTTRSCYSAWTTMVVDANNHQKRETSDAFGRLIRVDEYTGAYPVCSTDVGTPYATTHYEYDALGNLEFVTDAKDNKTEIRYDSLGRKYYMDDPDMGIWTYGYDANGNLTRQTDAKNRPIAFGYDALNRITSKDHAADGTNEISYIYDLEEQTNSIGRLSRMSDASGTTTYSYDDAGRIASTKQTVSGSSYQFTYQYENGKLRYLTYPDNEVVSYSYDGAANLSLVQGYAIFQDYNALGQPGKVIFNNNVETTYLYKPSNNLLASIDVNSPAHGAIFNLAFGYDDVGNIKSIDDSRDFSSGSSLVSESFTLDPARAHAVASSSLGKSFLYDANGNMNSDGERTLTYTYENMPKTITTSTGSVKLVYDGNNQRVKKNGALYLSGLYQCTGSVCSKHIFAGNSRVAVKSGSKVVYFHPDHLGSTLAVTDVNGIPTGNYAYYPFGEILAENGAESVQHRYTSQELDAEVDLYNYNARLYNPGIGRFISPDSIIPDYTNPQSLNRYAYVLNNPLLFTDSSGHYWEETNSGYQEYIGPSTYYNVGRDAQLNWLYATTTHINSWNNNVQLGYIPKLTHDSDRYNSIIYNTPAIFPIADNPKAASSAPIYQSVFMSDVAKYDSNIILSSILHGVDPDLTRSIMYLETTHGYYDVLLSIFDKNFSILPMNVQTPRWDALGTNRAGLKDPATNIDIGTKLISRIQARILNVTPSKIGSLYNSLGKERVSDYGGILNYYYKTKPWN